MENSFKKAKEFFRDVVDVKDYVPLSSSEKAKIDLLSAINSKEKMILLTGEAGSGKSMILSAIFKELQSQEKDIAFVSNPYVEINIIKDVLNSEEGHKILLIDEAQFLEEDLWEQLRIRADKGNLTIVFSTHDTDVNRLLAKKHFQTRINYIMKLKRISLVETENFITTKLLRNDLHMIVESFRKSNYKKIYSFTKGSLRATNQLMFKVFDIMSYFYEKYPHKINLNKMSNKWIEMAIIDLEAK